MSPPPTGNARTGKVSARVPQATRDALEALKPLYPSADGASASLSSALRGVLSDGFAILDPEVQRRVRAVASRLAIDPSESLRQVIERGLGVMERHAEFIEANTTKRNGP